MFLHSKEPQLPPKPAKKPKKTRSQQLQCIIEQISVKSDSDEEHAADLHVTSAQKLFKRFNRRLSIFQKIPLEQQQEVAAE